MARNLFVLSLLSIFLVGCLGPEKAPSPATDGGAAFIPTTLNETFPSLAPAPAPAPVPKPVTKPAPKPAGKSTNLPIRNAGNK